MSEQPLISIIVPTYRDGAQRLEKTLCSALSQSVFDIEIVVSDDGGDVPFSGVDRVIDDPRIQWLSNPHRGVAHTRNAAIRAARGKYIAFLDTGDWWERDKLQKQLALFDSNPELVLVYCSARTHDHYGRDATLVASKRGRLFRDLLINQPIVGSCSSALVPKRILDDLSGFYTDQDIPEDQELWLRIARLGEIDYVDEPLVHLEIGATSRSADPIRKMRPYQHFLQMYAQELREEGLESVAWAHYHAAIADKFFSRGDLVDGMKQVFLSLRKKITVPGVSRLFAGLFSAFGARAYSLVKHIYRSRPT